MPRAEYPAGAMVGNSARLVIGAWGANCYAPSGGAMFTTLDRDFFLPREHLSSIDTGKLPP